MRADFVANHGSTGTVVEVKTVLNTDYNPATAPNRKECVYLGKSKGPYRRAGIFPWGRVAQAGPKGEKVVSARAIKHVDELAAIAKGRCKGKIPLKAMMLFVVVRHDVQGMRVNPESCSSFAQHVAAAASAGVVLAAHRVRW